MTLIAIALFIGGALLAQRFECLILVPASLITGAASFALAATHSGLLAAVLVAYGACVAIQAGYIVGALISLRRSASADATQAGSTDSKFGSNAPTAKSKSVA